MHVCCEEPGDARGKGPYRYLLTCTLCPFLAQPYDISSQRLFKSC